MKLLIRSAMIFFGTLVAAAVLVLGEPAQADVAVAVSSAAGGRQEVSPQQASNRRAARVIVASKMGVAPR